MKQILAVQLLVIAFLNTVSDNAAGALSLRQTHPWFLQQQNSLGESTSSASATGRDLGALKNVTTRHRAWMQSGKYQGDIDLKRSPNTLFQYDDIRLNAAVKAPEMKWTDALIPYVLSSSFSLREKRVIEKAMDVYRMKTCVKFNTRTTESDYLHIVKSYGCYSQVGRTGGRQEVSLGRGCLYHEIIVHELMHAVGFWHEHSREDRDQHIDIRWTNIQPGMSGQFDKVDAAYQNLVGPYDYLSVMHYDSTAFSRNGMYTIEPRTRGFADLIGTATDLSAIDLQKINTLYKCAGAASKRAEATTPSAGISQPASFNLRRLPPPATTTLAPTSVDTVTPPLTTQTTTPDLPTTTTDAACHDQFLDCPFFYKYCFRPSYAYIMKTYCPYTCKHCTLKGKSTQAIQRTESKEVYDINRQYFTSLFG